MSAGDARLDRLHAGLTARERVVLIHCAYLADEKEDPSIRATIPREQGHEFNHFIALANGILHVLVPMGLALGTEVELLSERALLLHVLVAWGYERNGLTWDASLLARIPIAASELAAALASAHAEYLPMRDAAEWVMDERDVSSKAAVKLLRAAEGEIRSRRTGNAVEFQVGALCDWLGIEVPFVPDWGRHYLPVPDAEMPEHEFEVAAAKRFERYPDHGVPWPPSVLPAVAAELGMTAFAEQQPSPWGTAMSALAQRVQRDVPEHWSRLAALELIIGEVVTEFEDESVLPTTLRGTVARARETLLELAERLPATVGPFALPDADETYINLYRRALRRDELSYR